jgi:predicted phage gp36 major capsid-like protein
MSKLSSYTPEALNTVNEAFVQYVKACEDNNIDMRDCILFGMAQLYDLSTATPKQFRELAKFAIKISMRTNEGEK